MAFQPLGNRVLIEPQAAESVSKGGIIIPDVGKELPQVGMVLAVGPEAAKTLNVGDSVMYGKYAGLSVTVNRQDLLILDLDEILGTVIPDQQEQKESVH